MKHIFDTNAWLRLSQHPEEISPAAHEVLDRIPGPFALSAISIWEVVLKARKGRLVLTAPIEEWLRITLRPSFVQVISLDARIARLSAELPEWTHSDPADRFIVATAIRTNLIVVTSDARILASPHIRSLDTR